MSDMLEKWKKAFERIRDEYRVQRLAFAGSNTNLAHAFHYLCACNLINKHLLSKSIIWIDQNEKAAVKMDVHKIDAFIQALGPALEKVGLVVRKEIKEKPRLITLHGSH